MDRNDEHRKTERFIHMAIEQIPVLQSAFQNKRDWAKIETTGALFW